MNRLFIFNLKLIILLFLFSCCELGVESNPKKYHLSNTRPQIWDSSDEDILGYDEIKKMYPNSKVYYSGVIIHPDRTIELSSGEEDEIIEIYPGLSWVCKSGLIVYFDGKIEHPNKVIEYLN